MKRILILICIALATVPGATALASAPAVVAVSSRAVAVHRPELQRTPDGWRLVGCLAPQRGVRLRTGTHLDIVFFDAAGAELTVRSEALAVSFLRERPRRPRPHLRYDFVLGELPAGTSRVEVRAHRSSDSQH